jgi:hypothetical protein
LFTEPLALAHEIANLRTVGVVLHGLAAATAASRTGRLAARLAAAAEHIVPRASRECRIA